MASGKKKNKGTYILLGILLGSVVGGFLLYLGLRFGMSEIGILGFITCLLVGLTAGAAFRR